jgi:HAD superfamily hydrolase (TIGR01509 family)
MSDNSDDAPINILFPIGGKGERMKPKYSCAKPLIPIHGKPIFDHVFDHLRPSIRKQDNVIIICHTSIQNELYGILTKMRYSYENVIFIPLHAYTSGAAETIQIGINALEQAGRADILHHPTMCFDCDTFYTENVIYMYRCSPCKNIVYYVNNNDPDPIYSYIKLDEYHGNISKIAEKIKISDNANTGIYCFENMCILKSYTNYTITMCQESKRECYTSNIIANMIDAACTFQAIQLNENCVFNLGTLPLLTRFQDRSYAFLFDLDGTLVKTEKVYFDVWKKIFESYNFHLSYDLFLSHIFGHEDKYVVDQFFPDLDVPKGSISALKDKLFAQYIHETSMVEGMFYFLEMVYKRGYPIGIVTNSNRKTAKLLIQFYGIQQFVTVLVANGESHRPKPYPDPYLEALGFLGMDAHKAIIFEDSKTGLLSAKAVSPKCVVGIETQYDRSVLIHSGADITINNFLDEDPDKFIQYDAVSKETLIRFIKNSLHNNVFEYDSPTVEIFDEKLKGGFIAEVYSVLIHDQACVLKLENNQPSNLSNMSQLLCLYENEYYFYHVLSRYVPIKIPKFISLVRNDSFENVGILLENLYVKMENGQFHVDLNETNLHITYKILGAIAKMHLHFWNKNLSEFVGLKYHNINNVIPNHIQKVSAKFEERWGFKFPDHLWAKVELAIETIELTQDKLSYGQLTLCDTEEPYFVDWQYISHGKGAQDLVFFIIESFTPEFIVRYKNLLLKTYYANIVENGSIHYSWSEFIQDVEDATFYFPLFVMIWFGTVNTDELIDKEFPARFIQRFIAFIGP